MIDKLFLWTYCAPSATFNPDAKNSLARLDFIRTLWFIIGGIVSILLYLMEMSKKQIFFSIFLVFISCTVFIMLRYSDDRIKLICDLDDVKLKKARTFGIIITVISIITFLLGIFLTLSSSIVLQKS